MKLRFAIIYLILFMLFASIGSWMLYSFVSLTSKSRAVVLLQKKVAILTEAEILIKSAEISQKRFLVTGKQIHLDPYYEDIKLAKKKLLELRKLLQRKDADRSILNNIEKLLNEKNEILVNVIHTRKKLSIKHAIQIILKGRSRRIDGKIAKHFELIESHLLNQLNRFKKVSGQFSGITLNLIIGLNIFVSLLFLLSGGVFYRDILKKERKEQELQHARKLAEEATEAKSNFLASMSHEIRTPMNAIIGGINLILKTTLDTVQTKYVKTVRSSSEHLLSLINDILDFSKIESNKLVLERVNFSLRSLVESVADMFEEQFRSKKLYLDLELQAMQQDWIEGDPVRLKQILVNIIGNAYKFTEKGGVSVFLHTSKDSTENLDIELKISVKDTGIGIPEDRIESIFSEFDQADASTTRQYGGTGLGLSISKKIAQLMGGDISAESRLGVGTCFHILVFVKKGVEEVIFENARSENREENLNGMSLLVAEDNDVNQQILRATLESLGIECKMVETGVAALEELKEKSYDAILMDCQMPQMDGKTATLRIREQKNKIPIVALTANASLEEKESCLKSGMDDYLTKPFSEEKLIQTLSRFYTKRDQNSENRELGKNQTEKSVKLTENTENIINLEAIRKLKDLQNKIGQPGFLNKLVDIYLRDSDLKIKKINIAYEQNDFDQMRIEAHTLASSSLNLGGEAVGLLCRDIEKMVTERNRDTQGVVSQGQIDSLRSYNSLFKEQLQKIAS